MPDTKKAARLIDIAMNAEREKVVGVVKDLICDRDELIAALKAVDTDCKFCRNHDTKVPCQQTPTEFICDECTYDCPCRNCRDNSEYIWIGEVNQGG